MKARVNRDSLKKAAAKEIAMQMAKEAVQEQTAREGERLDTIIAHALHFEFGFGRKRLMRFFKAIVDGHEYTKDRYGADCQDTAYKLRLRNDGIDMDEIEKELDDYMKEKGLD